MMRRAQTWPLVERLSVLATFLASTLCGTPTLLSVL